MGLLSVLNLQPLPKGSPSAASRSRTAAHAPAMPAPPSARQDAQPAPTIATFNQGKPTSGPIGFGNQDEAFDMKDIDEFFPVTLNGKTKEMIAEELKNAKLAFAE